MTVKRKQYGVCSFCNSPLIKDEYALSIKLFGEVSSKYCLSCLSNQLDVSIEDLKDKIEEYKNDGCELFK